MSCSECKKACPMAKGFWHCKATLMRYRNSETLNEYFGFDWSASLIKWKVLTVVISAKQMATAKNVLRFVQWQLVKPLLKRGRFISAFWTWRLVQREVRVKF